MATASYTTPGDVTPPGPDVRLMALSEHEPRPTAFCSETPENIPISRTQTAFRGRSGHARL